MKSHFILLAVLLKESFFFAWQSLVLNKLRSFLTLLGVTIGIFSIIVVFSVVDSIRYQIEYSIESLGTKVLYIQKWPWVFSRDFPWWEYIKRPEPSYKEMIFLKQKATTLERICFFVKSVTKLETSEGDINNVPVLAVSDHFFEMQNLVIDTGRFLSESELNNGLAVAVAGKKVMELFPQGRGESQVKLFGRPIRIVGQLLSQGNNPIGGSYDDVLIIPYLFFEQTVNKDFIKNLSANIAFEGKKHVSKDEMIAEVRTLLRSYRKLPPSIDDNFSINEPSYLMEGISQIFGIVTLAGWIIGGFALLVGGFGIANIMFVSVYERINLIGIQMALGATRSFIFTQFLLESIFLSLIGGVVGLLLVFFLLLLASYVISFSLILSIGNIILGLVVSTVLGVASGVIPAWYASRMDPAVAIRQI
ncbi:MAG: ABC transporter permease [Bacteroidales bacterium]|nr:ABC transporter permease [Bacteroidales bacterium]